MAGGSLGVKDLLSSKRFFPCSSARSPRRNGWQGNGILPQDSISADRVALQLVGTREGGMGDGEQWKGTE